MSVTIYPTQPGTFRRFPKRVVSRPCEACARGYCQPGWCVDGIEHDAQPSTPECNVGHGNAPALLRAVGLPSDPSLCGAIDASEVAGVLADCETALRSDAPGLVADDDLDEALWLISVVRAAGREDVIDELAWMLVDLLQEEASRSRSLPDPA